MSWAGGDWTVGLSGLVLQKVQQLQAQNEKLNKERQQRQLQLDNSEAALHKQKKKYEEVRGDLAALQREMADVRDAAQVEVRARERLAHELQVKTGQFHSLEGQLESAKNHIQTLTQEIKRLEAELEKLQKGNGSGDSMLFSTPCWNMSSPWDHNGGFRVENESKAQNVRQQLQFGDSPKPSVGGASSPFPQQPLKSPPTRRTVRQSEASTPSSVFPWERDDLRSTPKGRPASSVSSNDVIIKNNASGDCGMEEALKKDRDELRVRVAELQRKVQVESECLKDTESRLAQAQREISSKEQNLTHTQEQLTRAQTRITQESDRAQAAEQRVKQLQEELKCQRQNAETSRCNAEQRRKDMEREHQRELVELQRERQALEKQHQQENNRLNQEIQQARTLHNTLQAQYDKVCLQKQGLERDLEDVRGKLKNAEADLRESQKRETQTEAKLTEAVRERESLTVSLAQMKKQEKTLQEEVKRLTEELAEALKLIKELQAQLAAPPPVLAPHPFSSAENSFSPSVPIHLDRSPPHHHSSQKKRPVKTDRIREEERMKYPSGREPGEGIDSEHIESFGSEESQKIQTKGIQALQSGSLRLSETDGDVSVTEQDTGIDDMDTDSFTSDSTSSTRHKSESDFSSNLQTDIKSQAGSVEKHDSSLKDLKKENAELRDELREIKYDLQKRLEDLETQRRAETEARTKLKQLSRKHSTQTEQHRAKALELKDSVTKLETQLEQEKKENTKLRETLAVLEREADERQEERETEEEEGSRLKEVLAEMEHKEKCTEEEMRVMKKKLEDLNFTLAQERQEREREREEEKKKIRREELEGLKIAQLQEELDNLRKSGSLEEKILKENNPVTYLQLERHPDTDYNAALKENNGFAPSPDMQVSICESVNLQNTLICDKSRTVELIMDFRAQTKPSEQPSLNSKLKGSTAESGGTPALSTDAAELDENTVLVLEVERLRRARDQEAEKAELNQRKLDDLQKQVNKQTMQLTQAFESQSKHIENLLGELHDKDCALKRQGEELQNCQDKIALLEAEQHTREDTDLSKASPQLKPFTEISRDISCDSVISNTSISDHELFSDEMLVGSKEVSQPTVQLPTAHSDSQNNKEINTSDISDKLQRCEVVTEVSKQDEIFPTSDVCHENASSSSLNPQTQRLSEMTDKVTEVENSTVSSSLQTEQSEILKFQQNISEEATDDISELQRVRKELQEAQDQLNVLQAQNEELALQGGVAKDEMLSVKRENEELKLKLKHVGKETDSIPEQDGLLPLANTEKKDFSVTNEEEMQDSAPLGQEEPVVPDEKFKDGEMKNIKCEDERSSKAEVHSLQEQIQALQTQVQDLSEQNRTQAEELQLWKISAMSPEETVGNNSPFILLREDELLFSCSPNKLHTQAIMTRTMMHQCSVTDMTQQCGLEDRDDHASFKEHESAETQMTNNLRESQGPSEGLMTGNEKVVTKETVREECETITLNHSKESPSVCVSDVKISDTKDRLSVLQTNPTDYCNSEIRQIASVCPEYKTKEVAARLNSQESINVSILTEYQTKVINSEPITGPLETEDSQNPDGFVSGHNVDETMETAALDQHCHCHGDTTDTHNKYHTTVQRQSDGSEPVRNDSAAQGQRAEVSEVTVDPNRAEVRDVRSVSTQTEESNESRDVDLETSSSQTQKLPVLHASTQTDEVQLKTEEDEDYNEPADSPPLSPAPQCVTDKLLISKVFPMSDPAHIAERIRQNRNRMSAAYDDTEYEPYGLPEVVMKGFADIPSGPACPYVLRRGLLGTDALPLPLRETTPQDENEEIEP